MFSGHQVARLFWSKLFEGIFFCVWELAHESHHMNPNHFDRHLSSKSKNIDLELRLFSFLREKWLSFSHFSQRKMAELFTFLFRIQPFKKDIISLSFSGGEYSDKVSGENSIHRVERKRLSRTVADLVSKLWPT